MAARHGKFAQISVAGTALDSFCDNLELSIDGETADTTGFGSTWHSSIAGLLGASGSLSGAYDPTASTGPAAVLVTAITGGASVAFVHKPGGTASGQRTNSFNGFVTNYTETSAVAERVNFSASFIVTGAVTPTTQ